VAGVVTRDLDEVQQRFTEWFGARHPRASGLTVELRAHAAGGYSNEVIFATATYSMDGAGFERPLVLRLPPDGPALFPDYDLVMQVAVQEAVAANGVPVPSPLVMEPDPTWLGSPFLVMPRIVGHDPGQLPVSDPWISAATIDQQQALHEGFLEALAAIHVTPWAGRPVADHLRGASATLADEVAWWQRFVDWTFADSPPEALTGVFDWCRSHLPESPPERSLLWGDVRVGNVIFGDDFAPVAVLDWEMASIGPAEMDLAWYTALEEVTEHFFGQRVPGFLTRDEIVARHEQALGRALVDYRWFEVFALARSTALNLRAARLGAERRGRTPRPAEDDAVLRYTASVVAAL
jgi:aminoglycoside phosphotransferase (APT) family kinase protein